MGERESSRRKEAWSASQAYLDEKKDCVHVCVRVCVCVCVPCLYEVERVDARETETEDSEKDRGEASQERSSRSIQ